MINVPANYQVEVTTKRINNVVLVGPEEDLEQLSAGSIEARINAEDLQVAVGTQTVAVQIQVPSNPRVVRHRHLYRYLQHHITMRNPCSMYATSACR